MKKNIGKAPSIQFYYKDFLADMTSYGPELIGAWILILIKIWHESDDGGITDTLEGFSRICHTNSEKMSEILLKFSQKNIANVTFHNGDVTGEITVVNRRWKGELKLRNDNRLRQNKHRKEKENNNGVTQMSQKNNAPSSSSSSSSSSINKNIYKKETHVTQENDMEYYDKTEQVPKPVNGELGKLMEIWAESINRDISQIPAKHRDGLDEWLPRGMEWCIAAIDWNKTQSPKYHTPASAFWNYAQHCRDAPKEKTKPEPKKETWAEFYERKLVKLMDDSGFNREEAKKSLDAVFKKYGMGPKAESSVV